MKYIFFVLSLAFLISCGPSKEERAQHNYNEGVKLMYKNQHKRAIEHFTKALELNPKFDDAFVQRAKVYLNENKFKVAIEDINLALEINPNNGEAYNTRAQALFYLGDKMGSCADWKKADELGVPNLYNKIRHCP